MRKINFRRAALGSASVVGMALAFTSPAFAQDTDLAAAQPTCDPSDPNCPPGQGEVAIESGTQPQGENITVTGSRIRRPNVESQVPITSVGGEEFFEQGQNNIGDTLNELPQLRSTFGQQNAGRFLGTTGLNLLDLRGLGTNRTLVLVNGRRHVAADILSNAASPDVNTIPNDLIERVDVVTGGNSAIYGSDAIAGVVNFVLRRDFEGIQIRGNAGVSGEGYGGNHYASMLAGMNFADGRGNITLHGEYAHADRLYGSQISFNQIANAFAAIDVDPAGLPQNSDGFPDAALFQDVRSASIHFRGLVPITQNPNGTGTAAPQCGRGFNSTNGPPTTGLAGSSAFNCTFIFNDNGTLIQQTGTRFGTGIIGTIVGGNGQTGREGTLQTVLPVQDRYNFNLLARYEFSPAFEAFLEAKFVRVETQGQQASPAFVQGITFGDYRERPRLDNPFLNPIARDTIAAAILRSGCNTSLTVACTAARASDLASTGTGTGLGHAGPLNAADIAAINNGTYRFVIARFLSDLGNRDEASIRETMRIVAGLRGTFNTDWNYEFSVNYGRVDEDTTVLGNIIPQRFVLAMDAAINPANGQIVCRSQFDPNDATGALYGLPGDAEALAEDIANCRPYNPFGTSDNSAAANYILEDTISRAHLQQIVVSGFVSGDSSQWFELPGGPVRFALGAEYRREEAFYKADPLIETGRTFYNALPTFEPDPFEVKEAFGEIQIPILSDTPFFENLTLSGAGRVAEYEGSTGVVYAYNGGLEWQPVRDLRFRANYGRSVRAPNYTETSTPLSQNFSPGFGDPCRSNNIGAGTQFRAANCAAALGPNLANLDNLANYSLEFLSGSNPDLQAETSDSYTIGAIFTPTFLPGFSLTVDYFDITVNDVIAAVGAAAIIASCYDQPTLDNPFCAQFTRNPGPGAGPNGEIPGQVIQGTLIAAPLNYAKLVRRGIDFELAYRRPLSDDITLNSRIIYTHQLQNSNFTSSTNPDFENRIMSELGDPQDELRLDAALTMGAFTVGYQLAYIGEQEISTYEAFNSLNGLPPQNSDAFAITKYPAIFYHDLRFEWRIREGDPLLPGLLGDRSTDLSFYFGVDNFTDVEPPLDLTGIGAGSAIYSIRGRNFYAGFRARF